MFKETYNNNIKAIDKYISDYISSITNTEDVVKDAFYYTVLNGGKRIRSVLCLEGCRMFGQDPANALNCALGIEFIHAYSLVHDDLPCLDNDDFRRNMPSCHKKYGEGIAVFVGDALLHTAFEVMSESALKNGEVHLKAMNYIAKCSGINGMIGGQFTDVTLTHSGVDITYETLLSLIDRKTTALIRAGLISGAYIGGANDEEIAALEKYAYNMGIAFQIRDDFEDKEQDENSECNPNFINLLGNDKAYEYLLSHRRLSEEAIKHIPNNSFLMDLNSYLFDNIK